jgi:hypothetical protein
MFKIKGKGDTREVWDGDRLVGHLHAHEARETRETVTYRDGRCERISSRLIITSWWRATRADGAPVLGPHGGRLQTKTLKAWTNPVAWSEK